MGDHRLSVLEREQQALIDTYRTRLDEAWREIATLRALVVALGFEARAAGAAVRRPGAQLPALVGVD